MGFDNDANIFSLVVTSSLLAVVTVPAWQSGLSAVFEVESAPLPTELARLIATTVLGPLLVGMALRRILPFVDDELSDRILKVSGAVLSLAGLILLVWQWRRVAAAGWPFLAALAVMTLGALPIGHLVGGPDPADRIALATACATRHIGITILVAASLPGPRGRGPGRRLHRGLGVGLGPIPAVANTTGDGGRVPLSR
jgi:BASS family bile acid:Na+ symporter